MSQNMLNVWSGCKIVIIVSGMDSDLSGNVLYTRFLGERATFRLTNSTLPQRSIR